MPAVRHALILVALAGCGSAQTAPAQIAPAPAQIAPAQTAPATGSPPAAGALHSRPRAAMTITVDQLKTWSDRLARAPGDAARTAQALGLPGELTRQGGAWHLTPPPPGTTRVMLVEGEGGIEHVELQLEAPLTRGALDEAFGQGRLLPRTGPGRPYKVAYHVAVPGAPFTCEVIAAFADEPTTPAAAAHGVVLRRDRA